MPLPISPGGQTPPVVGQNSAPGAMPMGGAGSASMPSQNMGLKAAGMQKLHWARSIIEQLLPVFGSGSEEGQNLLKALSALSKIAQVGQGNDNLQASEMQKMMMERRQQQPMLELLRRQGGGSPEPQSQPQQAA